MNEIFVISPKREHRDFLPRLAELLRPIQGLEVIGQGATGVKVRVQSPDFRRHLAQEVIDFCFIERAGKYNLAQ